MLSAFSMSYNGLPPNLQLPSARPEWELPLFPVIVNRRLRNKSFGFVEPPQSIQVLDDVVPTIEPGSSEPEVKKEPDCDVVKPIFLAAHEDMVALFLQRSLNEHVNSTFDLLRHATRDYLRVFDA